MVVSAFLFSRAGATALGILAGSLGALAVGYLIFSVHVFMIPESGLIWFWAFYGTTVASVLGIVAGVIIGKFVFRLVNTRAEAIIARTARPKPDMRGFR